MAKTIFTQIHPTTLADRSTPEALLPDYLTFVESMNSRIQHFNYNLSPQHIWGDYWPTDITFFEEVFNTLDEAETFLNTKASSICAACKTNGGVIGTPRENTPSWVVICPLLPPRFRLS